MSTGFTRRAFLASLAAAAPLVLFVRRAHGAALRHLESDPRDLDALAEVLLPRELGAAARERAVAAFRAWGADYKAGAELVHGYGTSRLRFAGPTPLTRWTSQLDALSAAASAKHARAFHELSTGDREALVRAALANERVDRLPSVAGASHVALALLAHFYASSEANDLCYRAQIGKSTCRPLADSPRQPRLMLKVLER